MKRNVFTARWALLSLAGVLGALFLVLQAPLPAAAQRHVNLAGRWDRLNPDQGNPTPEHEVLSCGGNARPNCVYNKQPEPRLGFENSPDSTFGHFRGEEVTTGWICPDWFPSGVCDHTEFVASGVMDLVLSDGSEVAINQELIVTGMDGQEVLYVYWVDQQFVCPWFRSFQEALAANPFPTPFNGQDWPAGDCRFP
jgi:hypothetical protein